jgi:hypothetical protein
MIIENQKEFFNCFRIYALKAAGNSNPRVSGEGQETDG